MASGPGAGEACSKRFSADMWLDKKCLVDSQVTQVRQRTSTKLQCQKERVRESELFLCLSLHVCERVSLVSVRA